MDIFCYSNMDNKLSLIPLIKLSMFGILFLGLLVHEGIHVYHSKSPEDICYSFGTNKYMFVSHSNYEDKEFESFKIYS